MMLKSLLLITIAILGESAGQTCPYTCNYCAEVYSDHTMCKTSPGSTCGSYYKRCPLSQSEINQVLATHNKPRQDAASGVESNADGEIPSATNMCEMTWDCELEKIAQKHAEQCVFSHDCYDCRDVCDERYSCVGQNIACSGTSLKPSDSEACSLCAGAANQWYTSEVGLFGASDVNSFSPNKGYGHYTQMIWAKSCKVGCGAVTYQRNGYYWCCIVCNYGPCGNFIGQPVYESGSPCSNCPPGTSCNSATYSALCV